MRSSANVSAFAARRTVGARQPPLASEDAAPREAIPDIPVPSPSADGGEFSETSASEDENQFSVLSDNNTGPSISPKRIFELGEDAIRLELSENQSIAILGICTIWVKTGEITILGARLQASPKLYKIYAPATLALPQITAWSQIAEFILTSISDDLQHIQFDTKMTIWDVPGHKSPSKRSFHIVGYSFQFDEVLRKRLKILDLGKWRSTMATISKPLREGRTVLICGSGSTGKSTFCRASINRLLTDREFPQHISESKAGVLLLDLDLARPELTPPGLIYLAHVRSTLLGSPDSHYAVIGSSQSHILRMHYLGAIDTTCISNADIIAIKDILSYCGTVRKDYPGCPVLINSSSWLLDVPYTQLSILVSTMLLSEIVYFDGSGSLKHRELLTKSMGEKCNLWGISSKVYRSAPASTIQWSYMQSYFHLVPSKREQPTWDPLALLSRNQKEMSYSGPHSMISAVVTLGERLALSSVAQALEDSIVAIVVVRNEESYRTQADQLQGESPMPFSSDPATIVPDMLGEQQANPACIVRSEVENLPYFQDTDLESNFLDPKWSECLGLAYITAIDPEREVIEIVTPIPEQIVSDRRDNGHRLVIVMGRQNCRWAPVH